MAKRTEEKPVVSKPVMYICGLALVGGLIFYMGGGSPTPTTPTKAAKKSTAKAGDSPYDQEDYTANFAPYAKSVKNVFNPLVLPNPTGGDRSFDAKPGIPTYLTGGEGDWNFTGTAADGNVTMALVENRTRADSSFLKVGQVWKTSTVAGIEGDHLLLKGPDGEVKSILMEADVQDMIAKSQADKVATTVTTPGGVAPITPPISGPIGGANAASLDPNNLSVQPDNPRPRRGRRGNRGGQDNGGGGGNG